MTWPTPCSTIPGLFKATVETVFKVDEAELQTVCSLRGEQCTYFSVGLFAVGQITGSVTVY